MPPDTHDRSTGRHEGVLAAGPGLRDSRVDTWVRSAAGRGHQIVTLGAPVSGMIADRPGTTIAGITLEDLYPPADPGRLVQHSLDEGFTGLSVLISADSVIGATSSDHHTVVETALSELCDRHPVSVLCCYYRDGAGSEHLDMAVAHHRDGLHERQLTLHHVDDTVQLHGEVDTSNLDVLVSALRRTTRTAPSSTVRIDLSDASFLSAGAAQALGHHTAAFRDRGGRVELHGVTPHLTRILRLLRLQPLAGLELAPNAARGTD